MDDTNAQNPDSLMAPETSGPQPEQDQFVGGASELLHLKPSDILKQNIQKAGFASVDTARAAVNASGKDVDIVLPPKRDGFVRYIHRTNPQLAEAIHVLGLDYSNQGMLQSTAIADNVLTEDPRFKSGSAVIMDIPDSDSRLHNDPSRSPGRVEPDNIVSVEHIGATRQKVGSLPPESQAMLLLPNTTDINPDTETGQQWVRDLATVLRSHTMEPYVANPKAEWVAHSMRTLGFDMETTTDDQGQIHVTKVTKHEYSITPPSPEEIKEWQLEATRNALSQEAAKQNEVPPQNNALPLAEIKIPTGGSAQSGEDVW